MIARIRTFLIVVLVESSEVDLYGFQEIGGLLFW